MVSVASVTIDVFRSLAGGTSLSREKPSGWPTLCGFQRVGHSSRLGQGAHGNHVHGRWLTFSELRTFLGGLPFALSAKGGSLRASHFNPSTQTLNSTDPSSTALLLGSDDTNYSTASLRDVAPVWPSTHSHACSAASAEPSRASRYSNQSSAAARTAASLQSSAGNTNAICPLARCFLPRICREILCLNT
jgi:hypothetical protein